MDILASCKKLLVLKGAAQTRALPCAAFGNLRQMPVQRVEANDTAKYLTNKKLGREHYNA